MTTIYEKLRESTIYYEPEPAPRVRDPKKPMQVICPGLPRPGTESLSVALAKLGYDYSYHGWDILFESLHYMIGWTRLARKKWFGSYDGESNITAADFDPLLGHSTAVTDAAASAFAVEMINAYPQAKVILNSRRDLEKWHQSVIKQVLAEGYDSWSVWYSTFWTSKGYWSWNIYYNYLWPLVFRVNDGNLNHAIRRNGKWIYREHQAMIRGLVPSDRLLEWCVEDGWEPLCKFLDKPVPNEPFPRVNDAAGFGLRVQQYFDDVKRKLLRNHAIALGLLVVGGSMLARRDSLFGLFTRIF